MNDALADLRKEPLVPIGCEGEWPQPPRRCGEEKNLAPAVTRTPAPRKSSSQQVAISTALCQLPYQNNNFPAATMSIITATQTSKIGTISSSAKQPPMIHTILKCKLIIFSFVGCLG
jgi:hypothetical protein